MTDIDVSCWGPTTWFTLHSITMGYPEKNVSPEIAGMYKKFFESLEFVLPCTWCRQNFKRNIEAIPIDNFLSTRRDIAYWLYQIHNLVNDETGVPDSDRPTFDEVFSKYDGFRGDCDNNSRTCGGDPDDKKCKIIIQDAKREISLSDNIYSCYWPLILIIVGLLITIAVISIKKNKK